MKTLIVDNHDSFTFNLLQLIGEVNGVAPVVVRNDEADWAEVQSLDFDNIVLSPGPGRPEQPRDFGICLDILDETRIPILGVCLGHQGIAHFFGGAVVHAQEPIHGRASPVHHGGTGLFHGIPSPFSAIRYHSLVCDASRLPACLEVTARAEGDLVMAVKHRERPIWGVQFHPESICTEHGRALLENFRELSAGFLAGAPRRPVRGPRPRLRSIPQAPRLPARDGSVELHAHRLGRLDAERVFGALFARDPRAFWLDSSLVEPGLSRFSFMGGSDGPLSASIEYRADSGELTVRSRTGTQVLRESVFDHLERELRRLECAPPPVPFDFTCGYVGYFGYELKRECGGGAAHRAVTPDAHFLLADRVIAFDHAEGATHLVCLAPAGQPEVATAWFAEMEQRLGDLPEPMAARPPSIDGERLGFRLSRDQETYAADIARCLEEIGDGESYEICLTNQLRARVRVSGLDLHRVLRRANPAPHAAFLRLGDTSVACSSPERFLRIDRAGRVEASPIKGTARRGATAGEDAGLREALRASVKDRAENLMIVDLVRNDLGQVCEIGSVQVPRLMDVESYATVHQMVSTIRGRLRPGLGAIACVRAAFPGGSMTGAPKIRTMEIIDRLEGEARGIYSGALGYLSLSGAADLNIVIRTAVVGPEEVSVGVGGAIVALSDPEAELQEVLLKGSALLRAIALVARGDEEHDIAGLNEAGSLEPRAR